MANIGELNGPKQWGLAVGAAVLVTAVLFFTYFKSQRDANEAARKALTQKMQENAQLEPYRTKLTDIDRQIANLKQQLEIQQRIVPDEKEVDGFMKMLDAEAVKAGVWIRDYTADPTNSKQYYTEVPFDIEIDGPYYSVLNFFDQVSKLERIVNIGNLMVGTPKKAQEVKAKHTYQYAPNESVVVTCTATTFFSHDTAPPASGADKAKGRS